MACLQSGTHCGKKGSRVNIQMFRNDRILKILGLTTLGLGLVFIVRTGCGTQVRMRSVNPFGVNPAEVEKIKGYVEKAGIKGQVVGIQAEDETYLVLVQRATGAPKYGRGQDQMLPVAPASYRVNKKTGEVTPAM